MEIQYRSYQQINKQQWQDCITESAHPSLYGSALYLDELGGKWDALILGNYEAVMPLIFKKKYGVRYLYQPPFLPQTGIFSKLPLSKEIAEAFISKAFSIFTFAEIAFPSTVLFSERAGMIVAKRNNFVVDLAPSYETLYSKYDPHFIKSLRRLQKLSLRYEASENVKEVTDLFTDLYLPKIKGLDKKHVGRFSNACTRMQGTNDTVIRKAYTESGELLAAVILLRFRDRLYNMMSCISLAGKKAEANYFLYNEIIREFSGKELVLDLEGSDIKGIADFYQKMSPVNEPYTAIRYNALPAPFRWFKK